MVRPPTPAERDALIDLWLALVGVDEDSLRGYASTLLATSAGLLDEDGPAVRGQLVTGKQWSALLMARTAALLEATAEAER